MRTHSIFLLGLAMLTLAGCSSLSVENKRVDYKTDAVTAPQLEVPPDLTSPATEDHYSIPGEPESAVATYSDFAKNAPQAKAAAVLPETRKVHLEHNGALHWLTVEDKPENIWPLVKAFWIENGFAIKSENPQAGVLETDWAENRANIPKTGLRKILGKAFGDLLESDQKDRYSVRLERDKDGKNTEIYVTHYGMEEVLSKDLSKWQSRPNDPNLETIMLQMLMEKLGGAEAKAENIAAKPAAEDAVPAPKLQTSATGGQIIALSEPFDKSWRKVGLALEHAGFVIDDKDRSNGVYFLRLDAVEKEKSLMDKLAFWRSDDQTAKAARYRVTVREEPSGCEVSALNADGQSNPETQRIINSLYRALGSLGK